METVRCGDSTDWQVGITVLASDTAPVLEVIQHEQNGLLAGFYDVDGLTRQALRVLDDPEQYRYLGQAGMRMIDESYSLEKKLPEMLDLYERTLQQHREKKAARGASP